jgi:hypothetical protein
MQCGKMRSRLLRKKPFEASESLFGAYLGSTQMNNRISKKRFGPLNWSELLLPLVPVLALLVGAGIYWAATDTNAISGSRVTTFARPIN